MLKNHSEEVRQRILETAKDLFLSDGYKKTTIAKIVSASGVSSGSIYHWYRNKQEIFEEIVQELMQEAQRLIERDMAGRPPACRYAALLEMELQAIENNPIIREIFCVALGSGEMFLPLVQRHTEYVARLFGDRLTVEECRERILFIHAAMNGYLFAFQQEREAQRTALRQFFLSTSLMILGLSKAEQRACVREIEAAREKWRAKGRQLLAQLTFLAEDAGDEKGPDEP